MIKYNVIYVAFIVCQMFLIIGFVIVKPIMPINTSPGGVALLYNGTKMLVLEDIVDNMLEPVCKVWNSYNNASYNNLSMIFQFYGPVPCDFPGNSEFINYVNLLCVKIIVEIIVLIIFAYLFNWLNEPYFNKFVAIIPIILLLAATSIDIFNISNVNNIDFLRRGISYDISAMINNYGKVDSSFLFQQVVCSLYAQPKVTQVTVKFNKCDEHFISLYSTSSNIIRLATICLSFIFYCSIMVYFIYEKCVKKYDIIEDTINTVDNVNNVDN